MREYSLGKILLATDGSKDAELAETGAIDLSKRMGEELHVVHSCRPVPHYSYPSLVPDRAVPPVYHEIGCARYLSPNPGVKVLDIGPGTGYYSLPIAECLILAARLRYCTSKKRCSTM